MKNPYVILREEAESFIFEKSGGKSEVFSPNRRWLEMMFGEETDQISDKYDGFHRDILEWVERTRRYFQIEKSSE